MFILVLIFFHLMYTVHELIDKKQFERHLNTMIQVHLI